jgi:hypothetical protein
MGVDAGRYLGNDVEARIKARDVNDFAASVVQRCRRALQVLRGIPLRACARPRRRPDLTGLPIVEAASALRRHRCTGAAPSKHEGSSQVRAIQQMERAVFHGAEMTPTGSRLTVEFPRGVHGIRRVIATPRARHEPSNVLFASGSGDPIKSFSCGTGTYISAAIAKTVIACQRERVASHASQPPEWGEGSAVMHPKHRRKHQ